MITVKVTTDKGKSWVTGINTDLQGAKDYFMGHHFNFGDTEEHPTDDMQTVIAVTQIQPLIQGEA